MNTIKECFDTILKGGKEESRKAARVVWKRNRTFFSSGYFNYCNIQTATSATPQLK